MRIRRFIDVLALTLLTACGGLLSQSPPVDGTRAYVLAEADGRPLPHLQGEGSAIAARELSEGMLQLRTDGTFYLDLTWYVPRGPAQHRSTRVYTGRWTRYGEAIRFEFDDGTVVVSELLAGALEFELDGILYRFVE